MIWYSLEGISGSLLGDESLTQIGHLSMTSLIYLDIPGHHTDVLACT